jgi:hypothetical protein
MKDLEATKLPVTASETNRTRLDPLGWRRQIRGVHGVDGSLLIDGANMERETPLNMVQHR